MESIVLISKERLRQIEEEKFDESHDTNEHEFGALTEAAICYAGSAVGCEDLLPWPWERKFDKRNKHSHLKKLVIAAALIAAEIDREIALNE